MLVIALAAAGSAAAQTPAKPAAQAEKEPVTIDAERIDGIGQLEVSARGAAEINQGDLTIFGDYLKYNQEFGRIDADGGVRLQLGTDRFSGPRLRYSTLDDTGTLDETRFSTQGDLPAHGSAQSVEFLGRQKYRLKDAIYTTCRPDKEDWTIEAEELDLNYETEVGTAHKARLRFYDTTILYGPYASFPLESRRKTGLLTPYYSHSSTRGLETGIPFYLNIAPEFDDTVTPVLMTKRGALLKNDFRYLQKGYAGELRLEYMPEDSLLKRDRSGVSWQHSQTFNPHLTAAVDYNKVSDDRYFIDLSSQVRQVSIGNLQQDAYTVYSNTINGNPYSLLARVQRFQTPQDPLAPIVPPYAREPQLNFSTSANDIAGGLDSALGAEYVRFTHPTLVQGSRVAMNPTLSLPVLAPGWFFTPKVGAHYAGYSIDSVNAPPGIASSPAMSVPWMSLDTGLVFERPTSWFGNELSQTLERRLFYVYAPFRNQDQIPVFDTALADFNFAQLFSENRFTGGDRFGDANQVTAAITTRFLQQGGQERLRATFGQRFYFSDERVGLTPESTLRTSRTSDFLASIGGRLTRATSFDATTQYDRQDQRFERYSISGRYNPELAKVVSASYRFNADPLNPLRQIDISGQWPFARGWYAVGRYNYSLLDKRLVEGVAALEYNAGCWVLRLAVQRLQAAAQVASSSFFFQLEFTGVGQVGTDEIVTLLKRNVPGYSVTNPTDPTLAPPALRQRLPFEQSY